ncbi:peptidase M42 [Fulvitalea axinellae]|uniref:Peptidase M42 n=1 Tax=Fulvitalea axinellae TaxID=1182444 RepID=A0AAU9CKG9_9BACT|nr:peptidase M42 [Fulvitalea axinellae]
MNISSLSEICKTPGISGFEKPIRDLIINKIEGLVDSFEIDNIGNLVAVKKGTSGNDRKVMVAAHMDEIGYIVKHIDDSGFLRFQTIGGFDPKTLTAQRVTVHGKKGEILGVMASKPVHLMSPEERQKAIKTEDFVIDTGLPKEEVEKYVEIGDPITREGDLKQIGECVNAKSIDNRVSVYILIETLKALQSREIPYDFYATFTVQEEVGVRGARVAAQHVNPDFGISLDTTVAFDLPNTQPHEQVSALGKGPAIKIMDAMAICDTRMVGYLKTTAKGASIEWQPEILSAGGTDTTGLQLMSKYGAIAGAISIPTRHLHQVIEMANTKDIDDCVKLLTEAIANIDNHDWNP